MTDIEVNAQFVTIKVPDDIDMSKPIPLRIARDEDFPNLGATTDGRRVFNSEEWAAKSMEMDGPEYKERQLKRMEAGRLVRAEVTENYDGWVTIDGTRTVTPKMSRSFWKSGVTNCRGRAWRMTKSHRSFRLGYFAALRVALISIWSLSSKATFRTSTTRMPEIFWWTKKNSGHSGIRGSKSRRVSPAISSTPRESLSLTANAMKQN
ncbi:hypothetical protein G3A56_16050 [Rhizobium oryzihabitans]|uniref:Uncharacterized protein n=1 Tax=Rhizobium oryzihabitans TaxID=2267833 RepID=A0A7L5BKB1_9HYPH|nr:hypothetical protein [Rhizobium oryzihabitans]QIB39327.1 hypothetical protein G3A56_16050 [Rhizobium oryzihabitans]